MLQEKLLKEQKREFVVEIESLCTKNISDIKSCQLVLKDALKDTDDLISEAEATHKSIHSGWKVLTLVGSVGLMFTSPPILAMAAASGAAGLSAYNIGAE